MKKARHEQIAEWAAQNAGSLLDLDGQLEVAGIEDLLATIEEL
jgi:hypothetical protein